MTTWRYYLDRGRGYTLYLRLREGEPYILGEALHRDNTWHQSDSLFLEKMLGKDYDYIEVSEAEFLRELGDRVITDDTSYGRPDEAECARLTALENKIRGIWATVEIPPGVAGITLESFDTPGSTSA